MGRTLDVLAEAFAQPLARYGFHEIVRQESGGFGDGLIVYQSGAIRLRLLSDRDRPAVEVSDARVPSGWHDLERIVQGLPEVPTPDDLASAFTQGYAHITERIRAR